MTPDTVATISQIWETYYDVVLNAVGGLAEASRALEAIPQIVRPPRPRLVTLAPGVTWPYVVAATNYRPELVHFDAVLDEAPPPTHRRVFALHREADRRTVCDLILASCQLRPRRVHRALRRLQVAREWCQYRAAGARREIDEIFRQQAGWHALLVREHNLLELGGGHGP